MPGTRKLGRPTAHRRAMLRGMVTYLLENGSVETTLTRAKEVKSLAEKMITCGKKNTLASRRQAYAFITKDEVAKGVADGLGSLGNLVTINSLDVDFTGILLTAVVENNTLKSVKLSYTMTVNSLKLKALVVNVNGNGAGKMECTYTFA